MGSRIMHLVIASKIADGLSIQDRASFLLGGIAPDAISPKDLSHFFCGDSRDYSRHIDYAGFVQKYGAYRDSPFIQGYLTHLIADDIWLQGFYAPWLKNRLEEDKDIFSRYHNDFRLLNGKLLEHYGLAKQLREELSGSGLVMDIDEVRSEDVAKLVPYAVGDMDYDRESLEQPLSVFTFDQIVGYIETSVGKGLWYMKSFVQ